MNSKLNNGELLKYYLVHGYQGSKQVPQTKHASEMNQTQLECGPMPNMMATVFNAANFG